jgi:hypothetical protein
MPLRAMLMSHADRPHDTEGVARAVLGSATCAETCTICADACLAEANPMELRSCIRMCLDCADICGATARVLGRPTLQELAQPVIAAQTAACALACRACARECARHADHHAHCRICMEACEACALACADVLKTLPVAEAA